jgi:hypothetical protein
MNATNTVFISLELSRQRLADRNKTYVVSSQDRNQAVESKEEEFRASNQTPKLNRDFKINEHKIVQFECRYKTYAIFLLKSTLFSIVLVKMRARFW